MKLSKLLFFVFFTFISVSSLGNKSSAEQLQFTLKDGTIFNGCIECDLKTQIKKRTKMFEKTLSFNVKPREIMSIRGSDLFLKSGEGYTVKLLDEMIQIKVKGDVIAIKARDIARIESKPSDVLDDYDKKTIEGISNTSFQLMVLVGGILSLSAAYLEKRYKEMKWRWNLLLFIGSWVLWLLTSWGRTKASN